MQASSKKNAIRRLMCDLSDWKRNRHEFPCINAVPLENNIFEWHCNIAANGGRFSGIVLHLILKFPFNYPKSPPDVKICTTIPHPNVISSDFICLDMIRKYEQGQYKGWTPAYSVCSILMQLQSFLFEESGIDQDYGGKSTNKWDKDKYNRTVNKIKMFKCNGCGHKWDSMYPEVKWCELITRGNTKINNNNNNNNNRNSKRRKRRSWSTTTGEKVNNINHVQNDHNWKRNINGEMTDKNRLILVSIAKNDNGDKKKEEKKKNDNINTNDDGSIDTKSSNSDFKDEIKQEETTVATKKNGKNGATKQAKNAKTNKTKQKRKSKIKTTTNDGDDDDDLKDEIKDGSSENNNNNVMSQDVFRFWDGIYYDVENTILSFVGDIRDLTRMRRVNKQFLRMVDNSSLFLRNGVQCWFHRSLKLVDEDETIIPLSLGFGVTPHFYNNNYNNYNNNNNNANRATLHNQIFGSDNNSKHIDKIRNKIGNYEIISRIDTTFDLLSSDAFENFGIRRNIFKDRSFTHFIPLYISKTHGKISMKLIEKYILKIYNVNVDNNNVQLKDVYHPYLAIYTIANIMKSLIVSVMQTSNNDTGYISLHYSINVLDAFFRYHHLLLSIYYLNKKHLKPIIQDQINLFLNNTNNCRNKTNIPDFGVLLMYLTLYEYNNNHNDNNNWNWNWNAVGRELLDENFTRQVKWVLNKYPTMINNHNNSDVDRHSRLQHTWDSTLVSRRLFMFQYFFLKQVCQLFSNNNNVTMTPKLKYFEYNENFGKSKDKTLAIKLQQFVKKIYSVSDYKQFFQMIEIKYPGDKSLSNWLLYCMYQSADRSYHKKYVYFSKLKKMREQQQQ